MHGRGLSAAMEPLSLRALTGLGLPVCRGSASFVLRRGLAAQPAAAGGTASGLGVTTVAATAPAAAAPAAASARAATRKTAKGIEWATGAAPEPLAVPWVPADVAPETPVPFPAGVALATGSSDGASELTLSCLTYNVLLPNSKDGWWIYKYYRGDGPHTAWPARQGLLRQQLLTAAADFVCMQEACELSWEEDFAFMEDAGYVRLLHEKPGRMRPATFWLKDRWTLVSALHRDRTLTVALRRVSGPRAGTTVFVANAHLSAGPNAERRLRQAEEAVTQAAKEAAKLKLPVEHCPMIFCGDFNSQGSTAVRELLVVGEVGPDFREHGDPTERGQQGKQITSKVRRQTFGRFADAAERCFGEVAVPATILAANIDSKMALDSGELTAGMLDKLRATYRLLRGDRPTMDQEAIKHYLIRVNKELGRGSECRFIERVLAERGQSLEAGGAWLLEEEFVALYREEVEQGKFWGVEHDLVALTGAGLALPSEGPTQLCFDHVLYTPSNLRLLRVQEPLTDEQRKKIWGEPFDVLPNAWHPSDHLPVAALFALR